MHAAPTIGHGGRPTGTASRPAGLRPATRSEVRIAARVAVPQRAYVTGMAVALGGIGMFFMAMVSAYIVRKGFSIDWQALELPRA